MAAKQQNRRLRVRDVFSIDRSLALVVDEDTPLKEVIRKFAERADLRGIFVVDGNRRLAGVITRGDLLAWARLAFGPRGPESRFSWDRLRRLTEATTAKEACSRYCHLSAVRPDDPLETALIHMISYELIDVPVVDKEGRILGDIRLTEILAKALELGPGNISKGLRR